LFLFFAFYKDLHMGGPTRIPGPACGLTGHVAAIKDGTLCRQLSPVPATSNWDTAHLMWVVNALLVASKAETRERNELDRCLVSLLNQDLLTQADFKEITWEYYSSVSDGLPYYVRAGSKVGFKALTEERKLCKEWFTLLRRIEDLRQTAAWHSGGILSRQISEQRKKLEDADLRYQKSVNIMNDWYKTIKDAGEVNKFVDEMKSIKDMDDDIHLVISIFKNPMKALKSQSLGQVKSTLSGSAGKWDVIKKGITMLGHYIASTELVAHHQTTIKNVMISFSRATEDIFRHSKLILELQQQRVKIGRLGEINPALKGIAHSGRL
jgi:hypothetical protein